jgi:hypothetical protein
MKKEKLKAWEWEKRGFIICATIQCPYLVITPLGGKINCYQSGGIHLYCTSEDRLACGCCGDTKKFRGKI